MTKDIFERVFVVIGSEYNYMPVGANYLAQALSENGETVIYLEQPSFLSFVKNPLYFWRIFKKFFYLSLNKRQVNIITITSKILPIRKEIFLKKIGLGFLYQLQEKLLNLEINLIKRKLKKKYSDGSVIVLFNDPFSYKVAKKFKQSIIIFRACDRYDKYPGWENQEERIKGIYIKAISESNIVLATSDFIYDEIIQFRKEKVFLFPNGYQDFKQNTLFVPSELRKIPQPIIGFVGAVNDWIDIKLIEEATKNRPQYSFVIIGPVLNKKIQTLKTLKNIYILGYKKRYILSSYYSNFDVAIAPFIINELSKGINPIKFYEYLAFGLPVVSTSIKEAEKFKDLIYIATNTEEFIRKIDEALQERNSQLKEKRKKFALENSWNNRAKVLIQIVKESGK